MTWFELRSFSCQSTADHMALIYRTRFTLFKLYARDCEQAYYLMKLARIERKRTAPQYNLLKTNDLFQLCEQHRSKIIDFEYEYAKFLVKKKNAHDAANWLSS